MGTEAALKTFTAEELDEATNNYARENSLGRGGFGTGYRGKLTDGSPVLVMKLNPDNTRQAAEKFTREVTILTRADHPHLSDLYGLGLVILQLLTGEKVNKVLEFAKFGLEGILDHLDKTVQWNPEIAKEVADVALKCRDRMSRPDLETVVLPMLKKYAEQTKGEKETEAPPPAAAAGAAGGGAKGGGGGAGKGHEKKGAAAAAAAPQKKGLFGYFFGKR
ncbi:unnamed protein product [Closterium sp. Naga37s-1]|nr:unnamed protein product [Closterium sp. Naga37s-1]